MRPKLIECDGIQIAVRQGFTPEQELDDFKMLGFAEAVLPLKRLVAKRKRVEVGGRTYFYNSYKYTKRDKVKGDYYVWTTFGYKKRREQKRSHHKPRTEPQPFMGPGSGRVGGGRAAAKRREAARRLEVQRQNKKDEQVEAEFLADLEIQVLIYGRRPVLYPNRTTTTIDVTDVEI